MKKKGWILLLVLVCVAFLVSCGKKASSDDRQGELVRSQAEDRFPSACIWFARHGRALTGVSPEHAQIVGSV